MANTPVVVLDDTLTDIADAIRAKTGGSATMTPSEMPTQIASIPSGGGSVGIPREINTNGVYGYPTQSFTLSLPSDATDAGDRAFRYAFQDCASLTSINLSSLTTVSGLQAFYYAFQDCSSLTSVNLSSLTTVSGSNAFSYAFRGCSSLTSINLSSLTTISAFNAFSSAFYDCTSLASLSFPALTTSSFGTNTNQFSSMLHGVTGCTVHFPAAVQSIIEGMTGYPNFGGTNTTVLFDL